MRWIAVMKVLLWNGYDSSFSQCSIFITCFCYVCYALGDPSGYKSANCEHYATHSLRWQFPWICGLFFASALLSNGYNKRFLLFAHSRHTISTHKTSAHRVERNSPWLTSQCSQLLIRSLPDKVLRPISSIFSRFRLINKILLCNFD